MVVSAALCQPVPPRHARWPDDRHAFVRLSPRVRPSDRSPLRGVAVAPVRTLAVRAPSLLAITSPHLHAQPLPALPRTSPGHCRTPGHRRYSSSFSLAAPSSGSSDTRRSARIRRSCGHDLPWAPETARAPSWALRGAPSPHHRLLRLLRESLVILARSRARASIYGAAGERRC